MLSTITDEGLRSAGTQISAVNEAPAEKVGAQKHPVWLKNSTIPTLASRHFKIAVPHVSKKWWIRNHFLNEVRQVVRTFKQSFLRKVEISGLAVIASMGLADIANAVYFDLDCVRSPSYVVCYDAFRVLDEDVKASDKLDAFVYSRCIGCTEQFMNGGYDPRRGRLNAGDYIDRRWYYFLDEGQYYYLDRGQYNLLGGLSYLLGHPCYPKLYERGSEQAVGFTNRVGIGWLDICGAFEIVGEPACLLNEISAFFGNTRFRCTGQVPVSSYDVWCCYFKAGDYIDRRRYYYLDKGQYYYLEKVQYNLLGGLSYLFEHPYYQMRYNWLYCRWQGDSTEGIRKINTCAIPEPSTIGFLGLGALGLLIVSRKQKRQWLE